MIPAAPPHNKITTGFGVTGPMWGGGRHEGVDFACPIDTPIFACADGVVVGVNIWGPAFGDQAIVIKHMLAGKPAYTIYAHCNKALVKKNDKVLIGQKIALSGAKGNVTGAHLHLECQPQARWTAHTGFNPAPLLAVVKPVPKPVIAVAKPVVVPPKPPVANHYGGVPVGSTTDIPHGAILPDEQLGTR